jgi:L-proline amide hydrolase
LTTIFKLNYPKFIFFIWQKISCNKMAKPEISVKLDEILGDTSHLTCEESFLELRGLKIATWRYSDPRKEGKPAVIAIHGGPAFCHNYILPLKLLAEEGHPVVFYDQCGCGKSSIVKDPDSAAPWLLTIDYYVEELNAIIRHHNLDLYYIYGSSWGTVVAQEAAVTHPHGLLGLMLDGALSDGDLYIRTQWRDIISTMPTFTQNLLRKLTDEKAFDSPTYQLLDDVLGKHFTCRIVPRPDCYFDSVKGMNTTIYHRMQGESEFTLGGVLMDWSVTSRLHRVTVPAIVLVGQFDTMSIECSQALVDAIPAAWPLVTIPRAAHCKLLDEPHLCIAHLARFLSSIEAARRLPPAPTKPQTSSPV